MGNINTQLGLSFYLKNILIKVLASLQVILEFFFFFTFPKKWIGRAMGNEALNWDGLMRNEVSILV